MKTAKQTNQVTETKMRFKLSDNPTAYIVSVHVRNLMATYGEKSVRGIIKELFLDEAQKSNKKVG